MPDWTHEVSLFW